MCPKRSLQFFIIFYGYHFIIKELVNKFEEKLECLGENREKYQTYFTPIEKEVTEIDKDHNKSVVTNFTK